MVNGRKVVALCISRLHDMENSRFVEELNKKLFQAGYSLWVYNITTDLYWQDETLRAETSVFDLVDFSRTDAVIYMDEKIKSKRIAGKLISRAQKANVPVIVVDGSYEGCIGVRFDYGKGFEQIVRHVVEEHHARKLHFIGGMPGNPFSDERLAVFRKVLEENGLPFDESMVSYGHFWAKPAKAAAEALVEKGDLPDAVICANDIMAINVSSVLYEHGISVPEDVIVTGFDGIDEIYFAEPTVTSARCGCAGLAKSVFRAVTEALASGRTDRTYLVEPELLLNDSCGCGKYTGKHTLDHLHSFNDRFYSYQDDTRGLSDMCERMQKCNTIEEVCWCLYGPIIHDMCCVIDKRCANQVINILEESVQFSDTGLLFFDTEQQPFRQRIIHRSEIIPDLERIVEKGYPLIFNMLDFMNIPLGYVCFHFQDYEITDYCEIPQILTSISMGLGGFVNWQHQKYLRSQIENMYKFDTLTGLYNRLSFGNAFDRFKEIHAGEQLKLTVILSDLDGLKGINDNYGHAAGDLAIAAAAEALRKACPTDALCVRFGGDEMLAVIPGEYAAEEIVSRIHGNLEDFNSRSGLEFRVMTSIGVQHTELTQELVFEQLFKEADEKMYAEKQKKKSAS